jgi:transcription elongation factor GreA
MGEGELAMITLNGLEARQHFVTVQGAQELRQRLEELHSSRAKLARELGNLSAQNDVNGAMYDNAQTLSHTHVGEIDRQINLLKRILATVKVIVEPPAHVVGLGSRVVVALDGEDRTYTIVGSIEVDPAEGKISNESPLGRLLVGKRVGDVFEAVLGRQKVTAVIMNIG